MALQILVVGGNGFVGGAICKAALSRGWQVTSISQSGRPFRTPNGHHPRWTEQVTWRQASAYEPEQYAHLMTGKTAVVHTLGTLFNDKTYKEALRANDLPSLFYFGLRTMFNDQGPLDEDVYLKMNFESVIPVLKTFVAMSAAKARVFSYISAEDVFSPFVPSRYIETKRMAERHIEHVCLDDSVNVRPVLLRPGLMYHPHQRPFTSLAAALLSGSAALHHVIPTPANVRHWLSSHVDGRPGPSGADASCSTSTATAQGAAPPLPVELVAQAVCASIEDESIIGSIGVPQLRQLASNKTRNRD